jgi:DNA-repair protein XRCC1
MICLSGFQNPLRGELRDKAIGLGAGVSPDWTPKCTHLVCAVANTPKHVEVMKSGHGEVVTKQWLIDCALMKRRLPEGSYPLDGAGGKFTVL